MLKSNVGSLDRVLRVVVGLALLAAFALMPDASYRWALLIGIVPLVTATLDGVLGFLLGLALIPVVNRAIAPVLSVFFPEKQSTAGH